MKRKSKAIRVGYVTEIGQRSKPNEKYFNIWPVYCPDYSGENASSNAAFGKVGLTVDNRKLSFQIFDHT